MCMPIYSLYIRIHMSTNKNMGDEKNFTKNITTSYNINIQYNQANAMQVHYRTSYHLGAIA